jgi:hypothetical protein
MGEQPGAIPAIAAASMRAGLTLEPEFDDVRIAGRYHNPPLWAVDHTFAAVTFITRVWRNSKSTFRILRIVCAEPNWGLPKRRLGAFFIDPTEPNIYPTKHRSGIPRIAPKRAQGFGRLHPGTGSVMGTGKAPGDAMLSFGRDRDNLLYTV